MPGVFEGTDGVHMFHKGKNLNGAFVKMSKPEGVAAVADIGYPSKMAAMASYLVESIDQTLKRVEEAGGRVHL